MRKHAYIIVIALLTTVPIISGCSRTSSNSVSQDKYPKRIVSLTPSNTEILFALNLGDRVVGVTSKCDYPPEAQSKPKVGDMNISTEKVVALHPDLVVADKNLNSAAIRKLKSLGIKVLATEPKTIKEVAASITTIGNATGRTTEANALIQRMSTVLLPKMEGATQNKTKKVMVVVQTTPLWLAGPKTLVNEMIEQCNAKNIAYDAKPGFNQFSSEIALARNPDLIIVTRKEDQDYFLQSPVWQKTKAVQTFKVILVDPDIIFRPGPRLTEGLRVISGSLGQ